ncbi:Tetratricopeptide repeat-containing protein [bacterium A37T11]|nr:Tetratricopeptide repeat-containing protein [bacterium A37T11]
MKNLIKFIPTSVRYSGLFAAALLSGCFSKKKSTNTDFMQNLSTRYNILYNGNLILDQAVNNRENSYHDNYQKQLTVFKEPTTESIQSSEHLMDSLIGKANRIILEKTKSKYIDQAYFLTGRANYEKGNYYNAAEFFTYVTRVYANKPIIRQAALGWKARSLIQIGSLSEASLVLDTAFMGLQSEKKSKSLIFATQADYYLRTGDTNSGVDMLIQAIENSHHKSDKLRWHYLLGQLLVHEGKLSEAYEHFKKVARSNVSYEMAFHANLNSIFLIDSLNPSVENKVALLKHMLRDDKNKEFKDQIYYQIGEVYDKAGDPSSGIDYFKMALQQESINNYQKTLSYLKLANLYFDEGTYEKAKLYYDSTAAVIQKDYPDYDMVNRKVIHLDTLISQLRIVGREDTLQWLGRMPKNQSDLVIDSLVGEYIVYLNLQKKQQAGPTNENNNVLERNNEVLLQRNNATDNRFYFNNPDAISKGLSAFKRRWGNRPLADNWRTGDKTSQQRIEEKQLSANAESQEELATDSAGKALLQKHYYTGHLPNNPELFDASDKRIMDALFNAGNIYRDDLDDQEKAIETYQKLLKRYPNNKYQAELYYNLYLLYAKAGNLKAATHYKEKLLGTFPDSRYSQILMDPQYFEKENKKVLGLRTAYNRLFELYTENKYTAVISGVDSALQHIPAEGTGIASQLAYLQALATGRIDSLTSFEQSLKQIAEHYPSDSLIVPLVKQHLAYIEAHRDSLRQRQPVLYGSDTAREQFVDEPSMTKWPELVINRGPKPSRPRQLLTISAKQSTLKQNNISLNESALSPQNLKTGAIAQNRHENSYRNKELLPDSAAYYFAIHVENPRVNMAPSRYGIGQFNRTQFAGKKLTHQLYRIDKDAQLLYIGIFGNYQEVKFYESRIIPLLQNIMKIPADIYQTFIITKDNLETLTDEDQILDYLQTIKEQ